ncbi:MAG: hypothetical protein RLZZ450_6356 [Pseudomonadota bacterium]
MAGVARAARLEQTYPERQVCRVSLATGHDSRQTDSNELARVAAMLPAMAIGSPAGQIPPTGHSATLEQSREQKPVGRAPLSSGEVTLTQRAFSPAHIASVVQGAPKLSTGRGGSTALPGEASGGATLPSRGPASVPASGGPASEVGKGGFPPSPCQRRRGRRSRLQSATRLPLLLERAHLLQARLDERAILRRGIRLEIGRIRGHRACGLPV